MSDLTPADLRWLEATARIAMPFRGTTAENPTVGAIVVSPDGRVLGRGVTAAGGRPHAEPQALAITGNGTNGATLYVTLEPCNHWGQTPPCVDAVLTSGVKRVVCGASDPDPRTAGQSIAKLRAAGIDVAVGQGLGAIERLHEGFFSRIRHGRPFVTVKLAVSSDGMIGRRDDGNVAITGDEARRWTHMQRAMSDAIVVGAETARLDNPRLDIRLPGLALRRPVRVILAGRKSLPPDLTLFNRQSGQSTVIITENDRAKSLFELSNVVAVSGESGRPHPAAALVALAKRGIGRVLVEGGAALTDTLVDAGLVDRFHLLLGVGTVGTDGVPATVHPDMTQRLLELGFVPVETRSLGCDMLTTFEKV